MIVWFSIRFANSRFNHTRFYFIHKSTKNNTLHSRSSMGGDGSAAGGPPGAPPGSIIGSHGGGSSIGERVGTRYSIERLETQLKNGVWKFPVNWFLVI